MISLSYFSLPSTAALLRSGRLIGAGILVPLLVLGLINQEALAGPIEFAPFSVYHASEYVNAPADDATQVDPTVSRQIEVSATVVDQDTGEILHDGVEVTGVNSADPGTVHTFRSWGDPLVDGGHFIELDYDSSLAAGSWTITATKLIDGESATASVGAHTPETVINPFDVSSVAVSIGDGLEPTLTWDLPGWTGAGSDYDLLAVQVVAPEVNWGEAGSIFFQENLATDSTSYTFTGGLLEAGRDYILRVRAAYWDAENGFANYLPGSTYSSVGLSYSTVGVPEPATILLVVGGLFLLRLRGTRRIRRNA
ncbi:MAG: hypothetical protein ACI9P7_002055 [Candidatus Azotimanducaceae bacterium]|jgi:hypothetical protein